MKILPHVALLASVAVTVPALAQTAAPGVTFAEHVAPIVYSNCARCHRPGEAAPFSLLSYEDVRRRARTIAEVTGSRYMPPWHADSRVAAFRDDRRLTDDEIRTIAAWVAAGMPRGEEARTPQPPRFTTGWQLGEPDLVVQMPEAFEVPADGPDLFRNFAIPLELATDRWVRAIEFRPQGRASHHALFFFDGTGRAVSLDDSDPAPGFSGMSFLGGAGAGAAGATGQPRPGVFAATGSASDLFGTLGGWAVGGAPAELPAGTARRLPEAADLVVQMHFHPSGKPEREQASIGLYFSDEAPARPLIGLQLPPVFGALSGLDIPPGERRYVIRDWFILPIDVDVLSGAGHAHYLATDMRMTARFPGSDEKQELLSLPKWDFNWQERYYFAEPVRLPAGTRIDVEIAYDNSADNPANPFSPPRRVTFGRESTDEMGSVILEMLPVRESDLPKYAAAVQEHIRNAALIRFMDRRVTDELFPR
jgi:mono/diheme cytochrome c family protein